MLLAVDREATSLGRAPGGGRGRQAGSPNQLTGAPTPEAGPPLQPPTIPTVPPALLHDGTPPGIPNLVGSITRAFQVPSFLPTHVGEIGLGTRPPLHQTQAQVQTRPFAERGAIQPQRGFASAR